MGVVKDGKRAEDQDFWFRTAYLFEKYKLLVWIGAIILLAFGFDFKTPAHAMRTLQIQIDTLRKDRDTLLARQTAIYTALRDIKLLACIPHPEQVVCKPKTER